MMDPSIGGILRFSIVVVSFIILISALNKVSGIFLPPSLIYYTEPTVPTVIIIFSLG